MQPGDEVAGRYRLEELQGHGPMSEVWRAYDETLDRRVALKMLSPTADLEGLVRHGVGSGTLTEAGTLLGTAAYISPEQAMGEPAGPASDVYSFGVILFRMLTGSLPFAADNALALIELHRHEPPPAVEQLNQEAPPSLAGLAGASLQKDPAARPQDGAALLAALGTAPIASEVLPDTEQTLVVPRAESAAPRRPWIRPAVGLAVVFLAAAGALVAWAVARPASTARGDTAIGSVAGATRNGRPGSMRSSLPVGRTTRTHSTRTSTGRRSATTGGRTTTTRTTAPTTTQVTTTAPPTTAPTTTTAQSTTTSSTTTSSTTTTAGTTATG